ncbi:transporter substrate-binding domain-containing protein [Glutamicibacter uratoxydans]|uniref:transporter substrate-binding domain-containing protein n=1 Tax=Glutamicibacter uratoxydans TaxID=43667 RepID=UPI003D6FE3AC
MGSTYFSRAYAAVIGVGCALMLAVCGCAQLPVDPEGTLEGVRAHTLRVGLSPNPDFVNIQGSDYSGSEVSLVRDFAEHLETEPEFVVAGEETLVKQLETGQLDLVVGGISSKTPWTDQVGLTRAYRETVDALGEDVKLVILVRPGENAFLSELEYFLDQRGHTT